MVQQKGKTRAITPEIGAELLDLYDCHGYDDDELIKHLKVKHNITMGRRTIGEWRQKQKQARSIASMRAVGPKVELVMGDQIDKLLKFQSFLEDQFLETWRRLPDSEKHNGKTLFKYADNLQKVNAQIFMVHGLHIVAKAGTTMDDISHKFDEKFDKVLKAVNSTDEDTQPEGDE